MKRIDKRKMIEFVSKQVDRINEREKRFEDDSIRTKREEIVCEKMGFEVMKLSKAIKEEIGNKLYFKGHEFITEDIERGNKE